MIHSLLIVDDDAVFRERLALSFRRRGYFAECAGDANSALELAIIKKFDAAVVDLKMQSDSGLALVPKLQSLHPAMKILILTGYGSIPTAIEAIRLGAHDYLTKPADTDQIERALLDQRSHNPTQVTTPSLDLVEWEHLQRVLKDCGGNVSAAARELGIERRTLQRKLQKYPPAS